MLGAVRFAWNATRGHRLRPWRSPLLKWRLETYTGRKAEEIGLRAMLGIAWREKRQLLRYMAWTEKMRVLARETGKGREATWAG